MFLIQSQILFGTTQSIDGALVLVLFWTLILSQRRRFELRKEGHILYTHKSPYMDNKMDTLGKFEIILFNSVICAY